MWIFIILAIFITFKVYAVLTLGRCKRRQKLVGKTILITGSNRGIGYETALNLAKRGARVIITSEDKTDLNRARDRLISESGNANIVAKYLDFLSYEGIRQFAEDVLNSEERLDVLVNNAGVIGLGSKVTADGMPPVLQVNYLGPVLLTNLLLGLLKRSAPSRIVNVVSVLCHFSLAFNPDDIKHTPNFLSNKVNHILEYSNSKVCLALFTRELAERLRGSGVTVNCLHPGVAHTKIFYNLMDKRAQTWNGIIGPIYYKTAEEGAQTSIHLAACDSVEGVTGEYFSDCRRTRLWVNMSKQIRQKVWNQTMTYVGLQPEQFTL